MWPIFSTRGGGMVYYALSLVREFLLMIPDRVVIFYGVHGQDLLSQIPDAKKILLHSPQDLFDNRDKFDVLFTPSWWGGVNMGDRPTVHVIPDIQEQYYPQFFSDEDLWLRSKYYRHSAKASTLLVTISEFSKSTIVEKFKIGPDKIRVVYAGIHPIFSDAGKEGTRPAGLPTDTKDFLFYPANSWNHKNHKTLLDALVKLKESRDLKIRLILTGQILAGDFNNVDLHKEIADRGLGDQVFHIGSIGLSELKYLYTHASALIHPSLFEGFGLPLVEAMAVGCPVIAATRTSIPEIAGDAAVYFDPENPDDIAAKIEWFWDNKSAVDARLELGKSIAREFTDRNSAANTLEVLEEAYRMASPEPGAAKSASRNPILTVVHMWTKIPDKTALDYLIELKKQFENRIEIVVFCRRSIPQYVKLTMESRGISVHSDAAFIPALSEFAKSLKSDFVFLADQNYVPPASLISYLDMSRHNPGSDVDVLYGDSYMIHKVSGQTREAPVYISETDDDLPPFCENYLLIRSEALRHELEKTPPDLSTDALIGRLYQSRSKARIYRTMALRFLDRFEMKDEFMMDKLYQKLCGRFSKQTAVGKLMRNRHFKGSLSRFLEVYFRMPPGIQKRLVAAYSSMAKVRR
jgi:glycosyltransferase involved in cell wall biosynthesis